MSGHTPGPWRVGYGDGSGSERVTAAGSPVAAVVWGCGCCEGDPDDTDRANARLIASAPDLLDACDVALNALVGCAVPAGGVDDRAAILDAQAILRAAIRKATQSDEPRAEARTK